MHLGPLTLPRLSRADAESSRRRHRHRAVLPLLNGPLELSLTAVAARTPAPDDVRVVVSWGEDRFVLHCPEGLPAQILRALAPDLGRDLPPDLAGLLLETALLPIIAAWEQASGRSVGVQGLERDAAQTSAGGLLLTLKDGDARWPIHLSDARARDADPSATDRLLELWPVAPRLMGPFPLPAALRVGTTRLPVAVAASLRPGDAVLLETRRAGGGVVVIAETWVADARCDADVWRLAALPRRTRGTGLMEWTMQGDTNDPGPVPLADPDELPVQLTFDVGRLEVTLGDLRRLAPGAVLELGGGPADLVRISAHGRPIGRGELVDVEGAAGVRIVSLFDHG